MRFDWICDSGVVFVCAQPAADLRGQAPGIPGGAAEEGGRDEADVCAEGERKGVGAEGG